MKYFKIIDRPYTSNAEYCYQVEDGYMITDKGTCINPENFAEYDFVEITAEEYEVSILL